MMIILLEGIVMCFILLLTCVIAISNGAVGGVALYENDVQQRVVELDYTTKEQIKKNLLWISIALFVTLFTLVPFMVYHINDVSSFKEAFIQMTIIMWIMGFFDRFFIDWFWVGKTKAWEIEGTEDLKPYIPKKVLIRKWLFTILGFPIISAIIASVVEILN